MVIGCHHDIGWLHITKNDGRRERVEKVEDTGKLDTNIDYLSNRQPCLLHPAFQCAPLDIIHDQIPASAFPKIVIDTWEVGMLQHRQDIGFLFELLDGFGCLLSTQPTLTHLLNCHKSIVE